MIYLLEQLKRLRQIAHLLSITDNWAFLHLGTRKEIILTTAHTNGLLKELSKQIIQTQKVMQPRLIKLIPQIWQ